MEVALFAKEVKAYIENVNEIDNETITLLIETIISVNKLQTNSKFRETSLTIESDFVNNLNNEIFDCRRYVVCCICHVSIETIFLYESILRNFFNLDEIE